MKLICCSFLLFQSCSAVYYSKGVFGVQEETNNYCLLKENNQKLEVMLFQINQENFYDIVYDTNNKPLSDENSNFMDLAKLDSKKEYILLQRFMPKQSCEKITFVDKIFINGESKPFDIIAIKYIYIKFHFLNTPGIRNNESFPEEPVSDYRELLIPTASPVSIEKVCTIRIIFERKTERPEKIKLISGIDSSQTCYFMVNK